MSYNNYMISRFKDSEAIANRKWTNISNFISNCGIENIDEYLHIEENFIKFLRMFYITFSTECKETYGSSSLASHIIVEDKNYNNEFDYWGLHNADERLNILAQQNMNYMTTDDIDFLLKCWIRELCLIYFFEISSGSSIKATDAEFCFILKLHENFEISEIFDPVDNVHIEKYSCE